MIQSYFKIALRNIARHKLFTVLNAFGLAMGMSISLLLISFYAYVSSFDDFHQQKDNIYRIITTVDKGLGKEDFASAPAALAKKLQHDYTGIRDVVRINTTFHGEIVSDKLNLPFHAYYADESFFALFDFVMVHGNARTALTQPNSIVLTEKLAKKISTSDDLLGQFITVEGIGEFEVTGIVKDETRTHLWFEALVSYTTLPPDVRGEESNSKQWTSFNDQYLYIRVDESADREKLQQSLNHISSEVSNQVKDASVTFILQSLGDITPGPDLENSIGPDADYTLIVVFGTICLLILLPACFNYASISIARALKRSKEIGLRKTLGSVKSHIFFQFMAEAITITIIALAGAILIFFLIRPGFEDMMPGGWLDLSLTWEIVIMFLFFAIVTGCMAGVFPAVFFAGLNPIQALKSKSSTGGFSNKRIRKGLIIFQFSLSFCFIVLLIVFSRQYRYNLNYDYGFNTENILDVELQDVNPVAFKSEFSRLSTVQHISMSSGILGLSSSHTQVRAEASDDSLEVFQLFTDHNYVENMGLQLIAGKNFPDEPSSHERYILVNEEFLQAWKIPTALDAIGKTFMVDGQQLEVIGVLKNFHYAPLQVPIKSFFLRNVPAQYVYANVKVASPDIYATRMDMEKTWNTLGTLRKFDAHFFRDEMEWLFHFYWALLKLIGYLGLLAISISILGLLGMVIYATETRIKEVGIRKVFGASEASLTYLLSKDFGKMMLLATLFAIPVCLQFFDDLLAGMQYYRVSMNVWDLLMGLAIFFIVGFVTVASQIRKAARANPIDTLRYE